MAAAQAERETALQEREEAQRKRTAMARIRNIALVAVSILALLAGSLGWLANQQRKLALEQTEQTDRTLLGVSNIISKTIGQMDSDTQKDAIKVFQMGAIHGNAIAMNNLGALYGSGSGVPQDYTKAREWYEKAAAKGDAIAMYNLGEFFENGRGVPQDYTKAREWYEKAAAKGDWGAMLNLGLLYQSGRGVPQVPQDYTKAREWWEKAADKGSSSAMTDLGALYDYGFGVAQDYTKAREWYEKAAAKGDWAAKLALERLRIRETANAERYAEALQLQEALAAKFEAAETKLNGKPGERTATELNRVVWFALFTKDFPKALTVADRSHALFPDSLVIETNRAHALMFIGHVEEAKALYLAHKGKPFSEQDKQLWEQAIAEDFEKFRNAGLAHPMMADIEAEFGISR
jgi:TPR repeat protein